MGHAIEHPRPCRVAPQYEVLLPCGVDIPFVPLADVVRVVKRPVPDEVHAPEHETGAVGSLACLGECGRGLALTTGKVVSLKPGDDGDPRISLPGKVDFDEILLEIACRHRQVALRVQLLGKRQMLGDGHADEPAPDGGADVVIHGSGRVTATLGVDVAVDQLAHDTVPPPRQPSPR